jgi:ribose 1,5-bisphosphokinase
MSGLWVFICGPSGAGKDSVMAWAAQHLAHQPDIVFSRRLITRPLQTGSDHEPITPQQYANLHATHGLAWHWAAHGFHYGIRAQYGQEVAAGRVVVVNGSREHANGLDAPSSAVHVVHISADPGQIEQRLVKRGRDAPHEVQQRQARNAQFPNQKASLTIVNQGTLAHAGEQLIQFLNRRLQDSGLANRDVTREG